MTRSLFQARRPESDSEDDPSSPLPTSGDEYPSAPSQCHVAGCAVRDAPFCFTCEECWCDEHDAQHYAFSVYCQLTQEGTPAYSRFYRNTGLQPPRAGPLWFHSLRSDTLSSSAREYWRLVRRARTPLQRHVFMYIGELRNRAAALRAADETREACAREATRFAEEGRTAAGHTLPYFNYSQRMVPRGGKIITFAPVCDDGRPLLDSPAGADGDEGGAAAGVQRRSRSR